MKGRRAMLLVGPTGSGKTPLGDLLEARGLGPMRCIHFDFGCELRKVSALASPDDIFTREDIEFIRGVLRTGAFLEDEHFMLARKMIESFLAAKNVGGCDLVVLNGLPRHASQAIDMDRLFEIERVIVLDCSPEVVRERICTNTGGDRAERVDDAPDAVRKRLELFSRRTVPLLNHYRRAGASIKTLRVGASTTAEELLAALERA